MAQDPIITVAEFKDYFYRDFPFAPADKQDDTAYVIDKDITKAIGEATIAFNASLWPNEDQRKTVFMYLTAYYLVVDIQNAQSGINSQSAGLLGSKSVGDVSESYTYPQWISNSPLLSQYTMNGYGRKYLTYLIPKVRGNIFLAQGGVTVL